MLGTFLNGLSTLADSVIAGVEAGGVLVLVASSGDGAFLRSRRGKAFIAAAVFVVLDIDLATCIETFNTWIATLRS